MFGAANLHVVNRWTDKTSRYSVCQWLPAPLLTPYPPFATFARGTQHSSSRPEDFAIGSISR
jgi:hypothetical protein